MNTNTVEGSTHKRLGRRSFQPRKMLPYTGVLLTLMALIASFTGVFAAGPYNVQVADRLGFAEVTLDDGAIVQYIGDNNVSFGAAGSGVFDSFVRVQASPTESGYNTDGTLQFDTKSGAFTHSILLSEIPTIEIGGVIYWEFFADINDSDSTPQISLDAFELYLTDNPSITGYPFGGPAPNIATKIYDWGDAAGDFIMINDVNQGSGRGDLRYLVPVGSFDPGDCNYGNPACTTYLVLYTEWGSYDETGFDGDSDGGFEEWKVKRYPVLQVSKDINGGFDRTVDWTIEKSVDPEEHNLFAGESASSSYTVTVTKDETVSNVTVSGTITILGDEKSSGQDISATDVDVNLSDLFNGVPADFTCSVPENPDGTYTIAAESTVTCDYSLTLVEPVDGTNLARTTFEVDEVTLSFEGSASILASEFVENLIGFDEINVDDTNDDGDFGPVSGTTTHTYTDTFDCSSVTYVDGVATYEVPNTATIVEEDESSSALVTVNCYAPVVSKTAAGEYDERHEWEVTKTVDPESQSAFAGDTVNFDWTVSVSETVFEENFEVSGTITVQNPNPFEAMTVALSDVLDDSTVGVIDGATCDFSAGMLTIAAGDSETCDYNADPVDASATENKATATLNDIEFDATDPIEWTPNVIRGEASLTDDQGPLDELLSGGPSPYEFTYSDSYTCAAAPTSLYEGDGTYSYSEDNTAIVSSEGEEQDRDTATTVVDCYAPIVSKNASASYDERHTWDVEKSVDPGSQGAFAGDAVSWTWTVSLSESSVDENFAVSGTIDITNPASSPGDMTVSLADELSDGTIAVVDCGGGETSVTVAPGATESCLYSASPSDASATLNTATATFNSIAFVATAGVSFDKNVINGTATLDDDQEPDFPLTLTAGEGPWEWTETVESACSSDTGLYEGDGMYSFGAENTATVTGSEDQTDSAFASTTVNCYAPVVEKDADTEWVQTYEWDIAKSVDPGQHDLFAGESALSDYEVFVDLTVSDSFSAFGTIWVTNPAGSPGDMLVDVADVMNGTTATVDCGGGLISLTVAAGTTETCSYTVDLADSVDRVNTATVTFNSIDFEATADVLFGDPSIIGYPEINVTDYFDGDLVGDALGSATGDFTFEYTREFACSIDQQDYTDGFYSVDFANFAEIDETGQSDDADVTLNCYAPIVTKTAQAGTFGQQVLWDIVKTASPESHVGFAGDSFESDYEITVTRLGATGETFDADAGGVISVENPHPSRSMTVSVADEVSQGGTIIPADVDCTPGTSVTVAAGETEQCNWNTSLDSDGLWTNTATVTLLDPDTGAEFTGTKDFTVLLELVNDQINVDDTNDEGDFGPVSDTTTHLYGLQFACPTDSSLYDANGMYMASFPNTATIVETGQFSEANVDLTCYIPLVDKSAESSFTRTYNWTIDKEAFLADGSVVPAEGITLNYGQSYNLEWRVSVDLDSAVPYVDSGFAVSGYVEVTNPNPDSAMLVLVSDLLDDGTTGVIDGATCTNGATLVGNVLTVPAGVTTQCEYSAEDLDGDESENTFTATLNGIDYSASAGFSFDEPTTEVNATVLVTDSFNGGPEQVLGTVSVSDALPKVFTVFTLLSSDAGDIPDYLLACGENYITNRADIWNYDAAVKGVNLGFDERTVLVTVLCDLGCTLTQGYWKTHSGMGPAPYDEAWENLGDVDGDGVFEYWGEEFFLSGQTWYEVFWTAPKGNAYYNLAHQYMAAKLNELNGASVPSEVADAMTAAEVLFTTYTPEEVGEWKGRQGERRTFIDLAGILGDYNEGIIGPGHCDEDGFSTP